MCGPDRPGHGSEASETDTVLRAALPAERLLLGGPERRAFPSACTRTITTTGCGTRPAFDASPEGSPVALRTALSRPASSAFSMATPGGACPDRLASPTGTQPSAWPSPSSQPANMAAGASKQPSPPQAEMVRQGNPAPARQRTPEPEPASATTSPPPTEQETAEKDGQPKTSRRSSAPTRALSAAPPQPAWEMRKTMRTTANDGDSKKKKSSPKTEAASNRKSSRICTSTSSPLATAGRSSPRDAERAELVQALARGAARTAFVHRTPPGAAPLRVTVPGRGRGRGPVSAPDVGKHPGAGTETRTRTRPRTGTGTGTGTGSGSGPVAGAAKTAAAGLEPEPEPEPVDGQSREQEQEQTRDQGETKSETAGGENRQSAAAEGIEMGRWAAAAAGLAGRGIAAYWRLVGPVFDGDSAVRRRVGAGRGEATWRDWALCALAAVFVFLAASAGVWAVRGAVWAAGVLGEVALVLRLVAGLGGSR